MSLPAGASPARRPGLPPFTYKLLRYSFVVGAIPPVVLLGALATHSLYLLQYIHVLTGGTWTGFDLFMGLVMSNVMRTLEVPQRVEVAKRLTPTTFFILPSLAATAITSGIYLAAQLGVFDTSSPWIIAAGVVVIILAAQGFGVFMPNSVRIFMELAKPMPDGQKIARLNMRNIRLAGSQTAFQVVLILIMAHLAVF